MRETYNFRPVDNTLATAGLPTEAQLRSVAEHGFEVVINLAIDNTEAALVEALGLNYIHIPVNFAAPTEPDLLKFFDAMDTHAASKRVSVFIALYRVIRLNWDRDPAFDLVRDLWQPDPIWQSFIEQMLAKHAGK